MLVELPYSLHSRYVSIAIAWTVITIPPIFINLGLFYGLWFGQPQLDRILVLTIPTAVLGIFTVIAIVERIWKLIQRSPQFRPIKSPRYGLDIFQWGYFGALLLISSLISSTLARGDMDNDDHTLQIRLLSLPASVLLYYLATLTFLSLLLNVTKVKLPFRFGSIDAGNVVRPAVFYIVEDVVAVDGNGGLEYREALNSRYESSTRFRSMIWKLSLVWMLAFYLMAAVFSFLAFKLPVMAVYAVGWAGPFPIAGLMTVGTIYYVKSALRQERKEEGNESSEPNGSAARGIVDERAPLLANQS